MTTLMTTLLMAITALAGAATAACSGQPSASRATSSTTIPTAEAPAPTIGSAEITFKSDPPTPTTGDNAFEVSLIQGGVPVNDAEVFVEFVMPAMPQMNMAEMRTKTNLVSAGEGVYRGQGRVMMAGSWNVTVTAMRGGLPLASKTLSLTSK